MINTQIQKFEQNWEKNYKLFGQKKWEQEPDFCYYIETRLPMETAMKLNELSQKFFQEIELSSAYVLGLSELHLTITLPGRLGTHFQKNDIPFMKKTLENITKNAQKIPLSIKNFNIFPEVIFAEVYDPSDRLQQLHETLCTEIPFSQHPEYRYQNYLPHISLSYGGIIEKNIKKNCLREFESLDFNIETITFGKANWKNEILEKPIISEYKLQ
jgi:hypothetical protein